MQGNIVSLQDTSRRDHRTPNMSRPARLRALLDSPDLSFLMEAHSGLSAKIVEEAGFAGIWASGLSISAIAGLARQQRGVVDPGAGRAGVHGRRGRAAHPGRRRHRLRQLQQRAPAGAQAWRARDRRRVSRGQAVPQDQLVPRRAAAAGRHGGVLRPHPGRQGRADRRRVLHRRPHRGADLRAFAWTRRCGGRRPITRRAPTRSWCIPSARMRPR